MQGCGEIIKELNVGECLLILTEWKEPNQFAKILGKKKPGNMTLIYQATHNNCFIFCLVNIRLGLHRSLGIVITIKYILSSIHLTHCGL